MPHDSKHTEASCFYFCCQIRQICCTYNSLRCLDLQILAIFVPTMTTMMIEPTALPHEHAHGIKMLVCKTFSYVFLVYSSKQLRHNFVHRKCLSIAVANYQWYCANSYQTTGCGHFHILSCLPTSIAHRSSLYKPLSHN